LLIPISKGFAMINLTPTQPASWSAPTQPVTAPVPAVIAVTPASSAARDTATGQSFSGRSDARSPTAESAAAKSGRASEAKTAVEPAPLLPRPQKGRERDEAALQETEAQRKAEQEAAETAEPLAPRLQEVLSTVWQASAAVVDLVMGRPSSALSARPTETAGPNGAGATPLSLRTAQPAANERLDTDADVDLLAEYRATQEPVAYTEQGTSTWTPLEAGTLISRRV